jgi:CRP-like cAMP-binding protein
MQESFVADHALLEALERRSRRVIFSVGHILFRQGGTSNRLYILREGKALLVMESSSGKVVMSLHVAAGSILGLPGIIANEPYTFTAIAHPCSDVRFVARNDFEDLIRAEPSLYPKVLEVLVAEVRTARLALIEILGQVSHRRGAFPA